MKFKEPRATMTSWKVISTRGFHIALIVIGAAFLLTGAFHTSLWFDESYSVAIVNHSFAEIWRIGSFDVHPVLYYWALHILRFIFGPNLIVYRIFTVFGIVAMAMLGLTHIRKDMNWLEGLLFSFLVLFMPYLSYMSIQIRMYSWAMFAVMLTWIYAVRIARSEKPKARSWVIFAVASICSAYLHYYALLTVFLINLALLVFLIVRHGSRRRDLIRFAVQAVAQLLIFLPWFLVLIHQLGAVSTSYWISFDFPGTVYELLRYPICTMQLTYAMMGNYGPFVEALNNLLLMLAILLLLYLVIWIIRGKYRQRMERKRARVVAAEKERAESSGIDGANTSAMPAESSDSAEVGVLTKSGSAEDGVTAQAEDVGGEPASAGESAGKPRGKRSHPHWRSLWNYVSRHDNNAAFLGIGTYVALLVVVIIASLCLHTMMVYFRYLSIALGPVIYFAAWLFSHIDDRFIVCSACVLLLATAIEAQALMIHDDYSSLNAAPFDYLAENLEEGDALVSSDIGFEGQTALRFPEVKQFYLNWQKSSSWGKAYDAYTPPLVDVRRWREVLDDNRDRVWVLGTTSDSVPPTSLQNILRTHHITDDGGYSIVKYETFYRPYERVYYTVALFEKNATSQ